MESLDYKRPTPGGFSCVRTRQGMNARMRSHLSGQSESLLGGRQRRLCCHLPWKPFLGDLFGLQRPLFPYLSLSFIVHLPSLCAPSPPEGRIWTHYQLGAIDGDGDGDDDHHHRSNTILPGCCRRLTGSDDRTGEKRTRPRLRARDALCVE